jgi:ABC-2 type transport system permease protein
MSARAMENAASGMSAFAGLFRRELIRFTRQPSRVAAAIITPLLIWGFLASGFAKSIAPAGAHDSVSYAAYLLPGVATLIAMFASIFAAMSLIEDRHEGFLRSVLVSPAPRWSIVAAKTGAGALSATLQSAIILLAAPLVGLHTSIVGLALTLLILGLTAAALTALGLTLAWRVNSSEGFHGVMNILLLPMWLLSGAVFPMEGAATWLKPVMLVNPLNWANQAILSALSGTPDPTPIIGTVLFALVMIVFASALIGRQKNQ